jgi:hypothetical protein
MNAIALSAPDGEVMAYACAVCRRVCAPSGNHQNHRDFAKEDAERCCVCRNCGGVRDVYGLLCKPCQAVDLARIEAEMPALLAANAAREAAAEATFAKSPRPGIARALAIRMSEISEECWCAGWLIGTEDRLWETVNGGRRDWGHGDISEQTVADLRELSDLAGGWIRYDDGLGEVFVPMAEWLKVCGERVGPRGGTE